MGYLAHGRDWLVVSMICSLAAVAMSMVAIWLMRRRKNAHGRRTRRL